METLRFLMVTSFYPPYHLGGDAVHVQYLARALALRGHEVHVEYSRAAYALKRKGSPAPSEEDDGVLLHPIPGQNWTQPVAAHFLGRSGGVRRFHDRLLSEVQPDVLHLHNVSLLGLDVFAHDGARSLYTAHDYWAVCPRNDLFKFGKYPCVTPTCLRCTLLSGRPPQLWRLGGWRGLPDVDCAIAPSRFMARALQMAVGGPVVHLANFAPDTTPSSTRGSPDEYFLFVGVLENHKGVAELVAAAVDGSFPVRIVGSGSLHGRLRELARGSRRVAIEGWVSRDRLVELYRGARALIVPSLWPENAPLAAVEALSCGTPLLVSRRGGLEELLHDGTTGFSFDPAPEGIAEAVDRLGEAPNPSALRANARLAYERYHHPDAYLARYLDIARNDRHEIGGEGAGTAGPVPYGA